MKLPQRSRRRVAAAVLARVTLLMETVEEGGTGDLDPHRRNEIAAGTQLRGVHEGSERGAGLAVDHAVALRRNLGDDAGVDRRGSGIGQLDVPIAVGLVQPQAPDPADEHEYAVLAPDPEGAPVLAREAQGRPTSQDLEDIHGCGRARLKRGVDLLTPAIVWFGARLPPPRRRHEEQPTRRDDDQTRHDLQTPQHSKRGLHESSATDILRATLRTWESRPDRAGYPKGNVHPGGRGGPHPGQRPAEMSDPFLIG